MHLRFLQDARGLTFNNETTVVYFLHYSTYDQIAPKISEPENSQTNQQFFLKYLHEWPVSRGPMNLFKVQIHFNNR